MRIGSKLKAQSDPQITPITQIKSFNRSGLPAKLEGVMKQLKPEYQAVCASSNARTHPTLLSESKMAETVVVIARPLKSV